MVQRPGKADGGSLQALDHAANWVRFADTKATVLTAALAAVTTMLATNAPHLVRAAQSSAEARLLLACLGLVMAFSFAYTLGWLVAAILPRSRSGASINRFSWPDLARTDSSGLQAHLAGVSMDADAWAQVLTLSQVAQQKYEACRRATGGFVILILAVTVSVISSALMNGGAVIP